MVLLLDFCSSDCILWSVAQFLVPAEDMPTKDDFREKK